MTTFDTVLLSEPGGPLPLFVARGAGTGAALVIVPSAFGVPDDLRAQMASLADTARAVVSFDPFFREDPGPAVYGDMPRVMRRIQGLDRERLYTEVAAAIRWARAQGGGVVVLGVCFGGPFALRAGADGLVDGVVTWHATRLEEHLGRAAEVRCPLRLHFGEVDPLTPPAVLERIRGAFTGREDVEIVVHPGATHGYSHPAAPVHDPAAEAAGVEAVRGLVRRVERRG